MCAVHFLSAFFSRQGAMMKALYDSSRGCQGRFRRFVDNMHKNRFTDIFCFPLCKMTKMLRVQTLATEVKRKGITPRRGVMDTFILSESSLSVFTTVYGSFFAILRAIVYGNREDYPVRRKLQLQYSAGCGRLSSVML